MAVGRITSRVGLGVVLMLSWSTLLSCAADDTAEPSPRSSASSVDGAAAGEDVSLTGVTIEVHNDPGCGCCTSWAEYLRRHGAAVTISEDPDRDAFRAAHGIGDDAASCHTALVDGYAIEGHVPVTAIRQLLDQRPKAAGLALPGMPLDSPGMGGTASDWARLPVMVVADDGSMEQFEF